MEQRKNASGEYAKSELDRADSARESVENQAKRLEYEREKGKLLDRLDREKRLSFLRSLVERWLIRIDTVREALDDEWLSDESVEEIFEKIDEIEHTHDIDRILPKEFRVGKDEYLRALRSEIDRSALLAKIDGSLDYLHASMHSHSYSAMDFFSTFIGILDRNLVRIQENTIDIKRSILR